MTIGGVRLSSNQHPGHQVQLAHLGNIPDGSARLQRQMNLVRALGHDFEFALLGFLQLHTAMLHSCAEYASAG